MIRKNVESTKKIQFKEITLTRSFEKGKETNRKNNNKRKKERPLSTVTEMNNNYGNKTGSSTFYQSNVYLKMLLSIKESR